MPIWLTLLISILGSAAFFSFIQFLITRHDIEGNASGTGPDAVRIKRYKSDDARIRGYANPYTPKKEYYLVKLEKAAALKLAAEYGGEIVKYEG